MATVSSIDVLVRGDASSFDKAADRAKQKADGLKKGLEGGASGTLFSQLSGVVTNLFSNITGGVGTTIPLLGAVGNAISGSVTKSRADLSKLQATQSAGIGAQGAVGEAAAASASKIGAASSAAVIGFGAIIVAIVATGIALKKWADQGAEEIRNVAKSAARLGTSVSGFAGLQHAAKMTGVEDLEGHLTKLQRNLSDASRGGGELIPIFNRLGLEASELVEIPLDQAFGKIADKINSTGTQADKVANRLKIFGRGAAELGPMLMKGSEGLDQFAKNADKLGLLVTGPQAEAVRAVGRAWAGFSEAMSGIGRSLAILFAPLLQWVADGFQGMAGWIAEAVRDSLPYIQAFFSTLHSFGRMLFQIGMDLSGFSGVSTIVGAAFQAIGNWLRSMGVTWESFGDLVIRTLWTLEFTFDRWREAWSLTFAGAQLVVLKFAKHMAELLGDVIPATMVSALSAWEKELEKVFGERLLKVDVEFKAFIAKKEKDLAAFRTDNPPDPGKADVLSHKIGPVEMGSKEAFSILNNTNKDGKMLGYLNQAVQQNKLIKAVLERIAKEVEKEKIKLVKAKL